MTIDDEEQNGKVGVMSRRPLLDETIHRVGVPMAASAGVGRYTGKTTSIG